MASNWEKVREQYEENSGFDKEVGELYIKLCKERKALGKFENLTQAKRDKLDCINIKRYALRTRYGSRIFKYMCDKTEEEIAREEGTIRSLKVKFSQLERKGSSKTKIDAAGKALLEAQEKLEDFKERNHNYVEGIRNRKVAMQGLFLNHRVLETENMHEQQEKEMNARHAKINENLEKAEEKAKNTMKMNAMLVEDNKGLLEGRVENGTIGDMIKHANSVVKYFLNRDIIKEFEELPKMGINSAAYAAKLNQINALKSQQNEIKAQQKMPDENDEDEIKQAIHESRIIIRYGANLAEISRVNGAREAFEEEVSKERATKHLGDNERIEVMKKEADDYRDAHEEELKQWEKEYSWYALEVEETENDNVKRDCQKMSDAVNRLNINEVRNTQELYEKYLPMGYFDILGESGDAQEEEFIFDERMEEVSRNPSERGDVWQQLTNPINQAIVTQSGNVQPSQTASASQSQKIIDNGGSDSGTELNSVE